MLMCEGMLMLNDDAQRMLTLNDDARVGGRDVA